MPSGGRSPCGAGEGAAPRSGRKLVLRITLRALCGNRHTQFAIQDSRLFGPNPWKILAPPSNYLSKKVSGQLDPWTKYWIVNSCYANWVYPFGLQGTLADSQRRTSAIPAASQCEHGECERGDARIRSVYPFVCCSPGG